MSDDQTFRSVLLVLFAVTLPVAAFYRIRSQMTRERLDRRKEGLFVLWTLRPIGIAGMIGLIVFLTNPDLMRWSSMPLPAWLRWTGVGIGVADSAFLVWTLHSIGRNLTDTVVTRKNHTLVTHGPYRWIRHPFYVAVLLAILANGLAAANWFILATGAMTFSLLKFRLEKEEALLIDRFGDEYRAYMARTNRFIPRRFTNRSALRPPSNPS